MASLRSALLICAAMSASSVAPAQVGPSAQTVLPAATAVSPSAIAKELLRNSETLAIPPEETTKTDEDSDSAAAQVDPNADLPT
ncbi:MAG TPA: hypothetical protein VNS53_02665, partial [Sphingomicrobium sp.]|nr:hypothetical protein [Sphingomicrobium sp.]